MNCVELRTGGREDAARFDFDQQGNQLFKVFPYLLGFCSRCPGARLLERETFNGGL
jgi:hypothetical protein